jgi:hypothetical protein
MHYPALILTHSDSTGYTAGSGPNVLHHRKRAGNIPIKDLQPSQIQKFYNRKLKEGLIYRRSEKTISQSLEQAL